MEFMTDTELNNTWTKLSSISGYARKDASYEFTSLVHHLNVSFLRDCYERLNRNKAVGVDKVSWHEYGEELEANLSSLVQRLKRKSYKPQPARRVYIPKGKRSYRPLGIQTIESKIVESGIAQILQSIYEMDFLECSYGFRPNKSAHQALKAIDRAIMIQPVNHIVEADIKGFFDNVNHDMLLDFMRIRIKDSSLLFLIKRFLKAGYVESGRLINPERGTPQGGIMSPILANIYLHYVLDRWYVEQVKTHVNGYCELVRYADDFVCLVQNEKEAYRISKGLENRFSKYGLTLHPEKTRVFSFGRREKVHAQQQNRRTNTFKFLGFTHFCDKTRKGYFKVGRKTAKKKFGAKIQAMNTWLKTIRNVMPTREWWQILKSKIQGHIQYYGVSGNYRSIQQYYYLVVKMVHKWLNRRSQQKKMSWRKMNLYLAIYPLPKPRIVHHLYTLSK